MVVGSNPIGGILFLMRLQLICIVLQHIICAGVVLMNFFEILLMFSYVMFATGLISLGCYLHAKIESPKAKSKTRHLEIVMTNLKDTVE